MTRLPARSARLLVTACDPGTANYLAPVLPRLALPWRVFAHREAAEILGAQGVTCTVVERSGWDGLAEMGRAALGSGDYTALVAGTSWGPTLDKAAIRAACESGLPSVAIVEHWSLYRERFSRIDGGVAQAAEFLPDRIWLNDDIALADALAAGLPMERLRVVGQPHLERQRERLAAAGVPCDKRVVFVSEQIRDDFCHDPALDPGFDEFTALEGVAAALPAGVELVIKLHPREASDKYAATAARLRAAVIGRADAGKLVAQAGRVVGMVSMLLLEAALVRGDVVSFMPGGRPRDFIGNRIGATRAATTVDQLRDLLASPGNGPGVDFGKRFVGSTERVRTAIAEFACA